MGRIGQIGQIGRIGQNGQNGQNGQIGQIGQIGHDGLPLNTEYRPKFSGRFANTEHALSPRVRVTRMLGCRVRDSPGIRRVLRKLSTTNY